MYVCVCWRYTRAHFRFVCFRLSFVIYQLDSEFAFLGAMRFFPFKQINFDELERNFKCTLKRRIKSLLDSFPLTVCVSSVRVCLFLVSRKKQSLYTHSWNSFNISIKSLKITMINGILDWDADGVTVTRQYLSYFFLRFPLNYQQKQRRNSACAKYPYRLFRGQCSQWVRHFVVNKCDYDSL